MKIIAFAHLLVLLAATELNAQSSFFEGKTIRIVVELPAGDAFAKTLKDPDLLAEAKKKLLEIDPTGGQDLESLAKVVLSANKDLVNRLQQLLGK